MTVESRQLEPRLTQYIVAGNPTGDSYVIHFPQGDAGGPCIYSGTARYLIEGGGDAHVSNPRRLRKIAARI